MTDYAATVPPRFMGQLDVRYMGWLDGRPDFLTLDPFSYYCKFLQEVITVPAGTHINGASVPRVPFAYWLFGERGFLEAGLHDYMCGRPDIWPRHIADKVYREAMSVGDVPPWARDGMYLGVRLGAMHGEAAQVDQAGFATGNADG